MGRDKKSQMKPAVVVSYGAGIAAISGFVIITLSARFLSSGQNAGFMAFWSAIFTLVGILSGIQNEVTRAVRSDSRSGDGHRQTSPIFVAVAIGCGIALIVGMLTPVWRQSFSMLDSPTLPSILLAVTAILYAGQAAAVGSFAGVDSWYAFAGLTATEAICRLLFVILAAVLGLRVSGFMVATVFAMSAWLLITLAMPRMRKVWSIRIRISQWALSRRMLYAMAAAAANAVLVNGFPLLMSVTTDAATYSKSASLVVAVSVTRAPLLIPIVAFQSLVITSFVDKPRQAPKTLARLIVLLALIAVIGAALAAIAGPTVMRLVFGPDYGNSAVVLGVLVLDAAFLTLLVLAGAVTLALDNYKANLIGWYTAVIIAVFIMFLPLDLFVRTALALAVGPIVGASIHLTSVIKTLREE